MRKNLLALAVATLVAAPLAQADSVNVTIYGKIRAGAEAINDVTADSSKGNGFRVVDNASRLGFKGVEDLGDGLMALWQIESGLQVDGDDNKGTEKDGRLNSRNTFVGLKGDFGKVIIGKNDTPYKEMRPFIDPLRDTTAEMSGVFHRGVGQNFHTRQTSTLIYTTPEMGGFEWSLGLAPDEAKTSQKNGIRFSTSLGYKQDAFAVGLAYERRADADASNNAAQALKLVGGYALDLMPAGKTELGLGLEQIKLGSAKRNAFLLSVNQKLGKGNVALTYSKAGASKSGAHDGAQQISLGGGLQLSKRTELVGYFSTIRNDNAGKYNFSSNSLDGLAAGKDPRVVGFGLNHSF